MAEFSTISSALFKSAIVRGDGAKASTAIIKNKSSNDLAGNISTSSFKYDAHGIGLKSTQQIPVDYSKFENHTFFNSAESNVNAAFDTIIQTYPFDGTKEENNNFLEKLTGFEKYVYDAFPKHIGYFNFSGSSLTTNNGTYIQVNDYAGSDQPKLSRDLSGKNILDPGLNSISFEMKLFVPP